MMYADDRYSVLICFQGMDTAGKDSMVREIFKGFNPRGVVVESFKTPSSKELQHDFMWRHYNKLPEKKVSSLFLIEHSTKMFWLQGFIRSICLVNAIPQLK